MKMKVENDDDEDSDNDDHDVRARITNFEGHSISRPQQKGT